MNNEERVKSVIKYIESNLTESMTTSDIAGHFYVNPKYLMRLFKRVTGFTITEYTNNKKVVNSIDSLVNTDNKILKIALDNGFNSLEYYSETFYKIIGLSPNQFRKEYKSNQKDELLKLKQEILKNNTNKKLSLNREKIKE